MGRGSKIRIDHRGILGQPTLGGGGSQQGTTGRVDSHLLLKHYSLVQPMTATCICNRLVFNYKILIKIYMGSQSPSSLKSNYDNNIIECYSSYK